jgi:hypothetical protein
MKIIKTYLRNRLHISTLDALMEVSMNGPELDDHAAVSSLVAESQLMYCAREQFNPKQARFENMNAKKRVVTAPPVHTACKENTELAPDKSNASFDDVADAEDIVEEADADEVDPNGADDTGSAECADPYKAIASFKPPAGFQTMPKPIAIGPAALKKSKLICHKFLSGWYNRSFTTKCYVQGPNFHKYAVYYSHDKKEYYHDLDLKDYDSDKHWVIIKKAKKNK